MYTCRWSILSSKWPFLSIFFSVMFTSSIQMYVVILTFFHVLLFQIISVVASCRSLVNIEEAICPSIWSSNYRLSNSGARGICYLFCFFIMNDCLLCLLKLRAQKCSAPISLPVKSIRLKLSKSFSRCESNKVLR